MQDKQVKKRNAYTTIAQQIEANKRYLERNPEAKERKKYSTAKSTARRFITILATDEDLEEFKEIILKKCKKS